MKILQKTCAVSGLKLTPTIDLTEDEINSINDLIEREHQCLRETGLAPETVILNEQSLRAVIIPGPLIFGGTVSNPPAEDMKMWAIDTALRGKLTIRGMRVKLSSHQART